MEMKTSRKEGKEIGIKSGTVQKKKKKKISQRKK